MLRRPLNREVLPPRQPPKSPEDDEIERNEILISALKVILLAVIAVLFMLDGLRW
jgi:hypothetical protein